MAFTEAISCQLVQQRYLEAPLHGIKIRGKTPTPEEWKHLLAFIICGPYESYSEKLLTKPELDELSRCMRAIVLRMRRLQDKLRATHSSKRDAFLVNQTGNYFSGIILLWQ